MKKLIPLFITIHLFGCSGNDFIDMKDVYITDNIAYMAKDSTPVNGKVRSFGYYKKPGAFAFLFGNKISYEGYYTDGIKDYKWLNFEPDKSLQEGRTNYIMKIKEIWDAGELLKMEYYGGSDNILMTKYYNGTQGEKDPSFRTDYIIQNNSSIDIILTVDGGVQRLIERQSKELVGITTHCGNVVIPSENIAFTNISIHKGDNENNLILIYEQEPIIDDLWNYIEKSIYDFEYTLIITDELID
jgi:hypothetical protein